MRNVFISFLGTSLFHLKNGWIKRSQGQFSTPAFIKPLPETIANLAQQDLRPSSLPAETKKLVGPKENVPSFWAQYKNWLKRWYVEWMLQWQPRSKYGLRRKKLCQLIWLLEIKLIWSNPVQLSCSSYKLIEIQTKVGKVILLGEHNNSDYLLAEKQEYLRTFLVISHQGQQQNYEDGHMKRSWLRTKHRWHHFHHDWATFIFIGKKKKK